MALDSSCPDFVGVMQVLFHFIVILLYILSCNKLSFDKTSFDKILRNETTSYALDRFYINLLLKSCQGRQKLP